LSPELHSFALQRVDALQLKAFRVFDAEDELWPGAISCSEDRKGESGQRTIGEPLFTVRWRVVWGG